MFGNTHGLIFLLFLVKKKMASNERHERYETYGSSNLRVQYLHDEKGKKIKSNSLFENIYDYWSAYHDNNKAGNNWHGQKCGC